MSNTQPPGRTSPLFHSRSGMSLKSLSVILFAAALLAVAFSMFELRRTAAHAQLLYELEQERQKCDVAIQRFMDGSDYLTAQVQQFVVKGEREYMDNYWREIYVTRSRDAALDTILASDITQAEHEAAENGKGESDALIEGEKRAMRLMSESLGIAEEDMPGDVASVVLTDAEAALSAPEKREAAVSYIFGPEYSMSKDAIRGNVTAFRNEISNRYAEEAISALAKTKGISLYLVVVLIIFFMFLIGAIICFAREVISPLMGFAADLTGSGDGLGATLPERGAREIRQFAKVFNLLSTQVEQNTKRLERMGYVDYLTNVPNRASITEYVADTISANKYPLGLMIVDIDNFKKFNDTYGHAIGDEVLRCVARAVCSAQNASDGISGRLCGEEFVVISQNASEASLRATAEKILINVRAISSADVALDNVADFHITVSVGGMLWLGNSPESFTGLLSKADKALYAAKGAGKDRYTFHSLA